MTTDGIAAPVDVSVVIAAWNAEGFLATAIDSALAQEGVTLEVIVANDASTDGTADLVERLSRQNPQLRLVSNPSNQGPSAARNRAIDAARGEWIAVLDADDRFLPGRLARMVAFAREKAADLVFDLFREVDPDGNPHGQPLPDSKILNIPNAECWDLDRWILDNQPGRAGMGTGYLKPLMRRATLETQGLRYRDYMRNSEDYALVADLLAGGGAVWVQPEIGYLYTRREGSISHRIGPRHLDAMIRFDHEFTARMPDAPASTQAALAARMVALEDARTLALFIVALQERRPNHALKALFARPRAMGSVWRWSGEVLTKRIYKNNLR